MSFEHPNVEKYSPFLQAVPFGVSALGGVELIYDRSTGAWFFAYSAGDWVPAHGDLVVSFGEDGTYSVRRLVIP